MMISMSRIVHIVKRAISSALADGGIAHGERILIALSGGADSVAMLHALHRLGGYPLTAAHLNHRLRGAESDRDEHFVRELCTRLQVELIVERADSLLGSSNLEERGRDLRHEFLNRVADRIAARRIALAHHADDQAETVMMRLLRGSGVAGLAAMTSTGPGRIVRPLLALPREQILAYLDAIGAAYVTDSSNLSPAILRNRIRHELIPLLEREYAPRLSRRLPELASEMRSLNDYLAGEAGRELHRRQHSPARLDLNGFDQLHPALANAMLREWLRSLLGDLRRVYRDDIDRIRRLCEAAAPGSVAELAGGWRLRCEYAVAVLERAPTTGVTSFEIDLACDAVTDVPAAGFTFTAHLLQHDTNFSREALIPSAIHRADHSMEALFDADEISSPLLVRDFRYGDRIEPFGMTGTRKVHDVFIDGKVPRQRRATWPIVETRNRILWIPGLVRSRLALVTANTKNLLQLQANQDVG
jgi:tRNA(Ile)-lysidine synthase